MQKFTGAVVPLDEDTKPAAFTKFTGEVVPFDEPTQGENTPTGFDSMTPPGGTYTPPPPAAPQQISPDAFGGMQPPEPYQAPPPEVSDQVSRSPAGRAAMQPFDEQVWNSAKNGTRKFVSGLLDVGHEMALHG